MSLSIIFFICLTISYAARSCEERSSARRRTEKFFYRARRNSACGGRRIRMQPQPPRLRHDLPRSAARRRAGPQHLPLNPKQHVKHKLWRHSGHKPYPFLAHASVSGIVEQGQCGFSQNVHTQRRVVFSGSRRVFSKYYV